MKRGTLRLVRDRDEGDVQTQLRKRFAAMQSLGMLKALRSNSGRRGGVQMHDEGTSDWLLCVKGGRFVAMEVKRPGKGVLCPRDGADAYRIRAEHKRAGKDGDPLAQWEFLRTIAALDGYSCVVHSVGEAEDHLAAAAAGLQSPGPGQWGSGGCDGE